MKMDLVFQSFPRKSARGNMGWSSVVLVETKGKRTGGQYHSASSDEWRQAQISGTSRRNNLAG
jgi:hypothetical protein